MFEVLLWVSVSVNNIEDLIFRVIASKIKSGKQDLGCKDVVLNLITPLRLSFLWGLIKIRATG